MNNNFKVKYSYRFYDDFNIINSYIKHELKNEIAAHNLLKKSGKRDKK